MRFRACNRLWKRFRRKSEWLTAGLSGRGAYPPLNVFRKGDDFIVVAEVPGVQKSDLDIQVKSNTLALGRGQIRVLSRQAKSASARAPCRPVRPNRELACRDRRRRRQSGMPRRRSRFVVAARRARQAEVDPGGLATTRIRDRMEDTMAETQELAVRDKKELVSKEEKTVPGAVLRPLRRHL